MDMDTTQITTAVIAAVVAVAGTIITFVSQSRKDANSASLEMARLQDDVEQRLWERARAEIDALRQGLDAERQARRMLEIDMVEERNKRQELETRVRALQAANQRLTAENVLLREQFEALGQKPDTGPLRQRGA
jgi:small-conductance mechanosensitive channel